MWAGRPSPDTPAKPVLLERPRELGLGNGCGAAAGAELLRVLCVARSSRGRSEQHMSTAASGALNLPLNLPELF